MADLDEKDLEILKLRKDLERARGVVIVPTRPFLFTLDQIALMIQMDERYLLAHYVYFDGRSVGKKQPSKLMAHNVAETDGSPEWRVAEFELIRWMKIHGFKYYEPGIIVE